MFRWLREPLLHFLLLGALIFAAYGYLRRGDPGVGEIVVSQGQQQHLVNVFTRTWQRPPSAQEFEGLVDDWIREEIAYREGRRLGFDQGDTVIRRRLRQKLEMLAEDVVGLQRPSDAQLQAYLERHPEPFLVEPSLSFRHVYFSRDRRGEQAETDAHELLSRIARDGPQGDFDAFGDPLPLPGSYTAVREGEVATLFGQAFATALRGLEAGQWGGPVGSGFGLHLVFIEARSEGRQPALDEVRAAVEREWFVAEKDRAIDGLYERLRQQYRVRVEQSAGENPGQ